MRTMFAVLFIKSKILDERWSILLGKLYTYRQQSDYGDIVEITQDDILPLVNEVKEFYVV